MGDAESQPKASSGKAWLWLLTVYVSATYLLICLHVQPPFTATQAYDESAVDTSFTDTFALCLICWPILVGIVGARLNLRERWQRLLGWSVWLGVPAGVLVLATTYFVHALHATDPGIRGYWNGQGVGVLGVGWLIVLWPWWSPPSSANRDPASPDADSYLSMEVEACTREHRDAALFDPDHMREHLPQYICSQQWRYTRHITYALWLIVGATLVWALVAQGWNALLPASLVLAAANAFYRRRSRRRAFIHYALRHSTNRPDECHRCGYDLQQIESERCPECGAPVRWGNKDAT